MKFFRNFTIKMNFILWKIAIKHNLIENTKLLFFFFLVGCVYIYNLSNKKVCLYNKKARVYVYAGGCLDKYISIVTWPPKQKFLSPPLMIRTCIWNYWSIGLIVGVWFSMRRTCVCVVGVHMGSTKRGGMMGNNRSQQLSDVRNNSH